MLKQLSKIKQGSAGAIGTIDIHDLHYEDIKFVQKIIDVLKEKGKAEEGKKKEKIKFASWPSNIKGKLTREEIYDYL